MFVVRAGAKVTRNAIAHKVVAYGSSSGLDYTVRWNFEGESRAPPQGRRAEPFKAPLLDGGVYDFAEVLGTRTIVLTFWASWCDPCVQEAPHLARLSREYADRGLAVVAVSIDEATDRDKLAALVADLALPYPVALDPSGEVLARFAPAGASVPLTLVIDRQGVIVYRHTNFEAGDEKDLERQVVGLLE